ncbi:putative peptidase S15 [Toxoplasma gondii GAB2-2007-GAL-DOM2]|uniref:Peptidase S15, putative n=11 Tax=Toxoplasma gondii TaxID=5811 RepID=B9PQG3_TOXGV|nr:putative peptidase S15 [Toxoplasma gondii GT1]ESS28846.1 putative peptidase S15 [Toxoplasma gondii VEG]KAF4638279.1 putative peptidase S15 [Toxoplasma gondii]KFG37974.1 putative peptidase S15 [Toxoplasma gondii p89]KFG47497.1 putative peptidase S15 [Toxoplasma gondii GAB2-2007-GAL-DOM2]KFG50755.1 putative peptidase S15 [Toxoplasma gondii FOU]KFH15807.1 putative peptidase S15 [Toxoplasma gondii MAS]PUA88732.1 putative peptidase S15 [Toxoplasma gondii TgCATBr9]RQX71752.1 putative peptidase
MGFSSSNWSWAGLGCGLLALAILLPPDPGLRFKLPPVQPSSEPEGYTVWRRGSDGTAYGRRTVYVESGGEKLHGWLYLPPKPRQNVPIYVVCHGFGAVMPVADVAFAEKLQEYGMAAIAFDYRTWGFSGGAPRQVVDPHMQLQDIRAVLQHIVDTGGFQGTVDAANIHLFGTSYAGGHVLVTASQLASEKSPFLRRVRSVTSVVPLIDGQAQTKKALQQRSFFRTLRYAAAILADLLRHAVGSRLQPVYLHVAGPRGASTLSALELQGGELEIWSNRVLDGSRTVAWTNALAARSIFMTSQYRPISYLENIQTPTLLVEAQHDDTCIPELTEEALKIINSRGANVREHRGSKSTEKGRLAELYRMPVNHFEIYLSPHLQDLINTTVAFAKRHGASDEASVDRFAGGDSPRKS